MNWFMWLLTFIVGSLIASFLISPNSFNSFKSNIENIGQTIIDNAPTKQVSAQPIPQKPTYADFTIADAGSKYFGFAGVTCSLIGIKATSEGFNANSFKKEICQGLCSKSSWEYRSFNCEADKLNCICRVELNN